MLKKQMIAIVLAGGRGSRLKGLTETIAKPAVHFGAKYRIIDFVLSNCSNSNIDTIGIITQYEPLELTSYIGSGTDWDLDYKDGGVNVLPPFTSNKQGFYWQKGTAHAVFQHLDYVNLYDPDYVLVLSADHVYKMNYKEMLNYHIKNKADVTISCINVDKNDAHRFGILNIDENNKVVSFEEKPDNPSSTLASMGVYIFNRKVINKLFKKAEEVQFSDFALDLIPELINNGKNVYAYLFDGYWRDIGTIQSLWQANLDLIDKPDLLRLDEREWPIMSKSGNYPPHHIFPDAQVKCSLIAEGSLVLGSIEHSVISSNVIVSSNAYIYNSVLMPSVEIGENCVIKNAIVKKEVIIPDNITIEGTEDNVLLVTNEYVKEITRGGFDE